MLADSSFWVMISFLLFAGLVFYFRIPGRVLGALDKRGANIGRELQEAKELRQEAQSMLASYRRRQKEAESQTEDILTQAHRESERRVQEHRSEMALHTERQVAMTEARIRQSQLRANAELRSLAVETAIRAASTILKEKMAGETGDAAIEESIKALAIELPQGITRARDL